MLIYGAILGSIFFCFYISLIMTKLYHKTVIYQLVEHPNYVHISFGFSMISRKNNVEKRLISLDTIQSGYND